jgi:hypothetical protein
MEGIRVILACVIRLPKPHCVARRRHLAFDPNRQRLVTQAAQQPAAAV